MHRVRHTREISAAMDLKRRAPVLRISVLAPRWWRLVGVSDFETIYVASSPSARYD